MLHIICNICTLVGSMNPLIQTLCRSQSFWTKKDRLGIVVIDEIHLVGDGARGFLLELICTKLLLAATDLSANPSPKMSPKSPSSIKPATRTQIVGMSATVPNLEQMGQWLNAIVYRLDFEITWHHACADLLPSVIVRAISDLSTYYPDTSKL